MYNDISQLYQIRVTLSDPQKTFFTFHVDD
jgi:hypothetical protein